MNQIQDNFYRSSHHTSHNNKRRPSKNTDHPKIPTNSKQKTSIRQQMTRQIDQAQQNADLQETRAQNTRLKKMLKQAQTKRTQITRECSEMAKKMEKLQLQNQSLFRKIKDGRQTNQNQLYRIEQLNFLNKQLSTQIEQLRRDNEELTQKLRYQTEIIERKYQDLQERTFKRIEQAMKRVKKGIHYLSSLTAKQIDKTKDIQVENLKKTVQILRGKYSEDKYQQEIEELMNPIKNIQQELHNCGKQLQIFKQENQKLEQQLRKHRKIERQLMPQYRQAIEKLKKNLYQLRSQLSENEYDKSQLKIKYEEKLKENQIKYEQLFKDHRKLKLQNKIYEQKLQEMQADVEEEKDRLLQQNQLLKKLYQKQDQEEYHGYDSHEKPINTELISHKTLTNMRKPKYAELRSSNYQEQLHEKDRHEEFAKQTIDYSRPKFLKKNFSTSNLRNEEYGKVHRFSENEDQELQVKNILKGKSKYNHLRHSRESNKSSNSKSRISVRNKNKLQLSDYYYGNHEQLDIGLDENSSMISQDGLKNEIIKIDKQIMQIQKTLNRQLQMGG